MEIATRGRAPLDSWCWGAYGSGSTEVITLFDQRNAFSLYRYYQKALCAFVLDSCDSRRCQRSQSRMGFPLLRGRPWCVGAAKGAAKDIQAKGAISQLGVIPTCCLSPVPSEGLGAIMHTCQGWFRYLQGWNTPYQIFSERGEPFQVLWPGASSSNVQIMAARNPRAGTSQIGRSPDHSSWSDLDYFTCLLIQRSHVCRTQPMALGTPQWEILIPLSGHRPLLPTQSSSSWRLTALPACKRGSPPGIKYTRQPSIGIMAALEPGGLGWLH